jgi:hypothetical protein
VEATKPDRRELLGKDRASRFWVRSDGRGLPFLTQAVGWRQGKIITGRIDLRQFDIYSSGSGLKMEIPDQELSCLVLLDMRTMLAGMSASAATGYDNLGPGMIFDIDRRTGGTINGPNPF